MKFLAAILSIYIFALNFVPCEDIRIFDNNINSEISQVLDDDHKHQDTDLCSSFCSCQCCHIQATHFKIEDFSISSTDISTVVFYHINGLEKDFYPTILQPPQV